MELSKRALLVALTAGLTACGENGELFPSDKDGRLQVALTDAPVESAAKVVITFDEIELLDEDNRTQTYDLRKRGSGCEAFETKDANNDDEACTLDLLTLANGNSVEIMNRRVDTDEYSQIRLGVLIGNDTYIELDDGSVHPLTIPSGAETGLKLVRTFEVEEDETLSFTIDFDVRKSLVQKGNDLYQLKPALRMVDTSKAGKITGTIDESDLIAPLCGEKDYINDGAGAVYIFEGLDVVPDDMDQVLTSDVDPLATTLVAYDSSTATFSFTAGFLPAGNYTVAYTCAGDDPELNEFLSFSPTVTVQLAESETETITLPDD